MKSDWIHVSERLPEPNQMCLICGKRGGMFIAKYQDKCALMHKSDVMTFYKDGKYYWVQWWMPLPEPPKEE
ncbi:MAG: DUF551 domain-containing protein [Lachnospiraceae bacterium]|nr:DUF551 domain-containing protein [Lachnospiraceae bacterium]